MAAAARSKGPPSRLFSASLSLVLLLLPLLSAFAAPASASASAVTINTATAAALASKLELLATGNNNNALALASDAKSSALNRTLGVISSLASLVVPETTVVLPGPQGPYLPFSPGSGGEGLPTIAFTGSAGLFIFYAGVAQGLIEAGLLVPGVSKMAGLSGGAITSAVVAAGVPPADLLASYDDSPIFCNATLPDDWASRGEQRAKESLARFATTCLRTAEWPLSRVAASVRKLIPAEAVPVVSKTVQIFASQINPLDYRARVSSPMGPYSSKEDLIDKISASSDLPCLVSGTSFTVVNSSSGGSSGGGSSSSSSASGGGGAGVEKPYVDGGFTTNFNQLCAGATEKSRCITVTVSLLGSEGSARREREREEDSRRKKNSTQTFLSKLLKTKNKKKLSPGPASRPRGPCPLPRRPRPLLRQRPRPAHLPRAPFALLRLGELPAAPALAVEGRQRAVRPAGLPEGFDDRGPAGPARPGHADQHQPGQEDPSAADALRVAELQARKGQQDGQQDDLRPRRGRGQGVCERGVWDQFELKR